MCDSRAEQMQHTQYAIHPTPTALESPQEAPNRSSSPREVSQNICTVIFWMHANDPSAGSPTETLLRLLLPLSDEVHQTFHNSLQELKFVAVRIIHRITQSVGATGGVYKGQGRNQHELMTHAY